MQDLRAPDPIRVPTSTRQPVADGPDDAAVVVTDLVKRYGDRTAVSGLSMTARLGQVTAVLGPNGAGKTSTIECCEGLRRPDGGSVRVLGVDPAVADADGRARVGVMLQDGGLPMSARAGELLEHVARLHADPLSPSELLDVLGLTEHRRTAVRRLSGGQRQRLALALALVGRPRVAFLDEPTAGLDPQTRLVVWEVVRRLREDGAAVVLTTHLMDDAEQLADHVVVVDGGTVVAAGSPAELTGDRERLRFEASAGLDLGGLREALPEGVGVVEISPGRYQVDGSVLGPQALATVTSWCAGAGISPSRTTLGRPSLEDVFLDLTGRELR